MPDDSPLGTPTPETKTDLAQPSIVDTILNLDELLSAEVRRAEKSARFSTKPHLEADIEDLEAELTNLVDARGKPLEDEDSLANPRSARVVAHELRAKQREYAESMRTVRMRALPEDEWKAFYAKHSKDLGDGKYTDEMFAELIVLSAFTPSISSAQLVEMRKKLGHPAIDVMATVAWQVNTQSGVSIPKSPISSLVLKQLEREQS